MNPMEENFYLPQTTYLKSVIQSIWQVDGYPGYHTEFIVPKGIIEMIFNFGESKPIQANINGRDFQLAKCFMNGYRTLPVLVELPQRHTYLGIQFHPAAIKHLLNIPAREFTNEAIDMMLTDGFFNLLWEQLAESKLFAQRVHIIKKWLEDKFIELTAQESLMNAYLQNPFLKPMKVQDLAAKLCYSPRHLNRKIYELTKMNTEEILLYSKYLKALHLLHFTDHSLTEIGYKSGFSDQSHFIKSFKLLTHLTPGNYREFKSHLPGHIFKNVR
ncbi:MAG: helix-turn-helix domain-containing protein [Saprospiraceae bacterium]